MSQRSFSTQKGHRLKSDLTLEQKKDISEAFSMLDMNGSKAMTPNDLKVALRALGYEPKRDVVRNLIAKMDRSGVSNSIVLAEFEEIMRQAFFLEHNDEELELAFPLFTQGKSEFITLDDMKRVADEVGEDMPEETLMEIIEKADVLDQDHRISRQEFMKMLTSDDNKH
ncbi:unnamed protein product [Phytomonas sp. Hart1]|nr:unnamed protein product [Phytomonas sp. Hart1]|eukprot:CCW70028.1 unnamed protein product [Phytomonas sp. isolate Hart1]